MTVSRNQSCATEAAAQALCEADGENPDEVVAVMFADGRWCERLPDNPAVPRSLVPRWTLRQEEARRAVRRVVAEDAARRALGMVPR